jgi:hypothetical protein
MSPLVHEQRKGSEVGFARIGLLPGQVGNVDESIPSGSSGFAQDTRIFNPSSKARSARRLVRVIRIVLKSSEMSPKYFLYIPSLGTSRSKGRQAAKRRLRVLPGLSSEVFLASPVEIASEN